MTRRSARTLALAGALALALTACSDSDDNEATPTTEADGGTDETTSPPDDSDVETSTTTPAADESEIGTTELLDHLLEQDPAVGALFDWNTGDGVIGVNYLGAQEVGLYAVEIDEATALTACELASDFVFPKDPEAIISVYTGGYTDGTLVVTRDGDAGSCAPPN